MDPLQPPLISKYEWEYKNDINQRMRVPDKLSVASSLPDLGFTDSTLKDVHYPDQSVCKAEHPENTPGYSPDLLIDGAARTTPSTQVTAAANATASATIQVADSNSGNHRSAKSLGSLRQSAVLPSADDGATTGARWWIDYYLLRAEGRALSGGGIVQVDRMVVQLVPLVANLCYFCDSCTRTITTSSHPTRPLRSTVEIVNRFPLYKFSLSPRVSTKIYQREKNE
ncbi:expressed protein [Echinococcus multilocularis]|uniref:Expressed protein n=1 Tax=Echinococcus multilocularis TaxID=6211 RepID=A0A068XW48_ECHMU|nr:expressed protein [Echinococcus multilocularis]